METLLINALTLPNILNIGNILQVNSDWNATSGLHKF